MGDPWLPPVNAARGTGFGVSGHLWSSGRHTGLDFPVPDGTPVRSCASGTVVYAGNTHGSYGIMVKLRHKPGLETWYCHLSSVGVATGQVIPAGGSVLGSSGHTGNVTGPHVHLEFRVNGVAVDPAPYLDGKKGEAPGARNPETGAAAPSPKPGKAATAEAGQDWSTQVAAAQPASALGDALGLDELLPDVRGMTLTALLVIGGFGLVAIGALYAASPSVKKAVAEANSDAMQAAKVAFPEVGAATAAAGAAGGSGSAGGSSLSSALKGPMK